MSQYGNKKFRTLTQPSFDPGLWDLRRTRFRASVKSPFPKLDCNSNECWQQIDIAAQPHHGRSCLDGPEAHLVNKPKFKPSQKPQPLKINCSCVEDCLIALSSADMLCVRLLNICQEGWYNSQCNTQDTNPKWKSVAASPAVRSLSCQAVRWLPSRWHTCY